MMRQINLNVLKSLNLNDENINFYTSNFTFVYLNILHKNLKNTLLNKTKEWKICQRNTNKVTNLATLL